MGRQLALIVAGVLATVPVLAADWTILNRYQRTIARAEFESLLTNVYDTAGTLTGSLTFASNSVTVAGYTFHFATNAPALTVPSLKRIVLDPGHIGGEWARMEERLFVRGKDRPVQEAALNLIVARLLKQQLEMAGVTVALTKESFQPVTELRPEDFRTQAEREVPASEDEATRADAVRQRQELLFYRTAEITARAQLVNDRLKPDLTICIHFNAAEWNECHDLVDDNRLLVFIHGDYRPGELAGDDQKLRLFEKLLERSHAVEWPVAEALAAALARATGLPSSIRPRNLAANRLYDGPVVYLEPYYMNNRIVYERIQLGDYDGEKPVHGRPVKSIFREYADAVMEGLRPFLASARAH
jgi:N-acetylmuramoyl-L-alanine amidase